MTDLSTERMEGEQWLFEPRTTDPTTTQEGERWLRTDLDSGDKIATMRVDVGDSIRDVPIFNTGTAVDTVSEAMRIQVNGVTGYVPIVPVVDAAYPELRMQHNSEIHGYHNRVEPGSAVLIQYLMDEGSGTSLADNSGNGNSGTLSGAGWASDSNAVGGFQTTYDGTDDYGEVDGSSSIVYDEFTVLVTVELDSVSGLRSIINNGITFTTPGIPGASRYGFFLSMNDDIPRCEVVSSGSSDAVDGSSIQTSQKYQLGVRLGASDLSIIQNGVVDNSTSRTIGQPNDTQYPITWGKDPDRSDFYLSGNLGTIEYHPEALSDQEIQSRFNSLPWS